MLSRKLKRCVAHAEHHSCHKKEGAPMKFAFSSKLAARIFWFLVLAATCLTLAGFVGQFYTYLSEDWGLRDFLLLLDPGDDGLQVLGVKGEGSVPAWFSSSLLMLCSLLTLVAPATDEEQEHAVRYSGRWKVLALLLLLMSLDEAVALHERTSEPLRWALSAGGPFYYAWVIPGAIIVLGFALAYRGFLLNLPPKLRRLFAIAGILYLGGALIMEMVGGSYADSYGDASIAYLMIVSVEEYLEMLGGVTLLYALMLRAESP